MPELSVVIPVFNSAESLKTVVGSLIDELRDRLSFEIILVNDCSSDDSWDVIETLERSHPGEIIGIDLARNFGEHNAVMAGYRSANGDYIVNVDDDLQNPPSEIPVLLDQIKKGYDVVYSRYDTKHHSRFRNLGSYLNDRVATVLLKKPGSLYLSSFRIITASLRDEIVNYWGPYPYIDGLILRATARIGTALVEHAPRSTGRSKYTLVKLLRLWANMFFNFSVLPLRLSMLLGVLFSVTGFVIAVVVLIEKLTDPDLPIGWASTLLAILILSGVQLVMLGILGEYAGRTHITANRAPQYVVHRVIGKDRSAG